ncbi:uncharacterized protein [Salminus brasiliensis]|uniref:uncharacterized protein n=1 Tax=Salminus brasiliensis TaxID=930266 RepID=UPI003B82D877
MPSEDNTEVYIPKDACVRTVPVQCLPSSIARKIAMQPSPSGPERSVDGSSQMATWICPVELRKKGASTYGTAQTHRFLTRGHVRMPVISSNPTASRIFHRFLSSGKCSPQAEQRDAPAVSSLRRNAVILYSGQIFLSVRKKKRGQADSRSFSVPVMASRKPPSPFPEEGGQAEEAEKEPLRREAGCPLREECARESDVGVRYKDEPMESAEEAPDPGQQADEQLAEGEDHLNLKDVNVNKFDAQTSNAASTSLSISISCELQGGTEVDADVTDGCTAEEGSLAAKDHRSSLESFPVISHITSLAKGWSGADVVVNDGMFCSRSEEPTLEEHQNRAQVTETPPPENLQNGGEGVLPCFMLPSENLDFEALEREERIRRIQNSLRNMHAKLDTLNSQQ